MDKDVDSTDTLELKQLEDMLRGQKLMTATKNKEIKQMKKKITWLIRKCTKYSIILGERGIIDTFREEPLVYQMHQELKEGEWDT